jgi:hypothetical protein
MHRIDDFLKLEVRYLFQVNLHKILKVIKLRILKMVEIDQQILYIFIIYISFSFFNIRTFLFNKL